jgi:uncharacterized membrane protein
MPKSTSSPLATLGRVLYALALLGFGVQYALNGHLRRGIALCPPWLHPSHILAYALAALLIAAGLSLLTAWRVLAISLTLGLLLLVSSGLYLQHVNYVFHDADGRTLFLECLSFAATALILHGLSAGARGKFTLMPGRIFFAFAMVVFGLQHFLYIRYLTTLVPAWIPYHNPWVLITGFALIAAGLSIATTIEDKYASYGLFLLFFGWLVVLHAPRIFHALHSSDEWSSGLVVLGLSGASLLLAASSTHSKPAPQPPSQPRTRTKVRKWGTS